MQFKLIDYVFSKKTNFYLIIELDKKRYNFKGSYVLFNSKGQIVCCTEDFFCTKDNKISRLKHHRRIKELVNYIGKYNLTACVIYSINEFDYVFDFGEYKFLIFSDKLDDHNKRLQINNNLLPFTTQNLLYDLKRLNNMKVIDIEYFFNLNHIALNFETEMLIINCYFKVIQNGNYIFSSYCMREKDFTGHFEFLENLLRNICIIKIEHYENHIFRLTFTKSIEIYIYIDNRFNNNQSLIIKGKNK